MIAVRESARLMRSLLRTGCGARRWPILEQHRMCFTRIILAISAILVSENASAFEFSVVEANGVSFGKPVIGERYLKFDVINTGKDKITMSVLDCSFFLGGDFISKSIGLVIYVSPGEKKQSIFRMPNEKIFDSARCSQNYVRRGDMR